MNNETVYVKKEKVFGKTLVYPVCHQAQLLTNLTGQKTLTHDAISIIKALKYSVKEYINKEL